MSKVFLRPQKLFRSVKELIMYFVINFQPFQNMFILHVLQNNLHLSTFFRIYLVLQNSEM